MPFIEIPSKGSWGASGRDLFRLVRLVIWVLPLAEYLPCMIRFHRRTFPGGT